MSAVARTYADIIREYGLEEKEARRRLYAKIKLVVAYLQLTAGKTGNEGSSLNRLIRRKLLDYLPADILEQPGFCSPLD